MSNKIPDTCYDSAMRRLRAWPTRRVTLSPARESHKPEAARLRLLRKPPQQAKLRTSES